MNIITIIGNLTRDPELVYAATGTPIVNITVADNYRYKDKRTCTFFKCVAFSGTAEAISNGFSKGSRIAIIARAEQKDWNDRDGRKRSEIVFIIDRFQYIDKKTISDQDDVGVNTEDNTNITDDIQF